jgi:hypothetical protein
MHLEPVVMAAPGLVVLEATVVNMELVAAEVELARH